MKSLYLEEAIRNRICKECGNIIHSNETCLIIKEFGKYIIKKNYCPICGIEIVKKEILNLEKLYTGLYIKK